MEYTTEGPIDPEKQDESQVQMPPAPPTTDPTKLSDAEREELGEAFDLMQGAVYTAREEQRQQEAFAVVERILTARLQAAEQSFAKECQRFHEEGHTCVTCGRQEQLAAQGALLADAITWAVEWTIKQLTAEADWPQSWKAGFPSYKASALLSYPRPSASEALARHDKKFEIFAAAYERCALNLDSSAEAFRKAADDEGDTGDLGMARLLEEEAADVRALSTADQRDALDKLLAQARLEQINTVHQMFLDKLAPLLIFEYTKRRIIELESALASPAHKEEGNGK